MKTKLLFPLILFLFSNLLFSQVENFSCGAEMSSDPTNRMTYLQNPIYSGSTDPTYLASFPQISFNVYFWIVNRSDGTNEYTVSYETILENMRRVNELFKPMGICFVLKGYDFINNSNYYDHASYSVIPYYKPNCFNVYVPNTLSQGNGATTSGSNKLGLQMTRLISIWEFKAGDVLAHELAHDFNLYHTWGNNNYGLTTPEHVIRDPLNPDYNALTTADLVADTPAMTSFYGEAGDNPISTVLNIDNCTYIGSKHDELGVPLQLTPTDVGNVMAYTYAGCIDKFTVGQGIRIREWIADPSNANKLCMTAKRVETENVDLFIRDSTEDFGEEPNISSPYTWSSPDIWVRHHQDYNPENQNPEYHPTNPNYIHVRIGNRGCGRSSGHDQLKVYWSKAATSLGWDYHWTGNTFDNGALMGNLIGTFDIPEVDSNQEIVMAIPWNNMPSPADYQSINSEPWHFCLLARIVSNEDSMTYPEQEWLGTNVANNNNIAQKNVTIVDIEPNTLDKPIGGVIAVGNVFEDARTYTLELIPDSKEVGKKIFEEAEVTVNLDEHLVRAWNEGGQQGNNIRILKDNKILITGIEARLDNIKLNPREIGTLNLKFNFLVKEITNKEQFTYHVLQRDVATNKVVGGETYEIRKHTRNLFYADAGDDKLEDKYATITLSAEDINEPAKYNWYDSKGNLVFEGLNFEVSVEAGKKFKLEVIALSDGYKDYSEVEVKLKPNSIANIYPNPVNNNSTFVYKINQGSAAYLSINPLYMSDGISQNYMLDINQSEINIDFQQYPEGVYLVTLITDGEISDTKYIIKQ